MLIRKLFTVFSAFMIALVTLSPFSGVYAEEAETEENPVVEITEHGIEITKSCAEAIDAKLKLFMRDEDIETLKSDIKITKALEFLVENATWTKAKKTTKKTEKDGDAKEEAPKKTTTKKTTSSTAKKTTSTTKKTTAAKETTKKETAAKKPAAKKTTKAAEDK